MQRRNQKAAELGRLELFRKCHSRDLDLLASIADEVTVAPGELLCQEGRAGYECFVIASGLVEVRVQGQPVAVFGTGEIVGEMAVLDGGPRTASVVALTDVRVFAIEHRRVDALLEQAPTIARAMLSQLSARLRRADEELVSVTLRRVK